MVSPVVDGARLTEGGSFQADRLEALVGALLRDRARRAAVRVRDRVRVRVTAPAAPLKKLGR